MAVRGPWAETIRAALEATAAVAAAARAFTRPDDLWSQALPLHPLGGAVGPADETCGGCAWRFAGGPGKRVGRCRQRKPPDAVAPRVADDWPACAAWEPPLDEAACGDCGACCHRGFHLVPVGPRAPVVRARPGWIVRDDHGLHLPRPDGFCVALARDPGGAPRAPWRCAIYDERPRACRDFAVGSDACMEARRRTGNSRSP